MRANLHSRTADITAAIRASHFLYDEPKVFVDPFAVELTSPTWRLICRNRLLHWLVIKRGLGHLRPVHGWILTRSILAEELLREFVSNSGRQYVQIGAGFDSISLRRPDWINDVKLFELDHPATQAVKHKRIGTLRNSNSKYVEYLSVDLEIDDVGTQLHSSSYTAVIPAFFSWMGVIYYLTRDSALKTLRSITRSAASGTELVFDFLKPTEEVADSDRDVYKHTGNLTKRLGEPYESFHTRESISSLATDADFEVVQMFDAEEIAARYAGNCRASIPVMSGWGLAHFRKC